MWNFPEAIAIDPMLASAVGGDPIVAQLLARRGLTTPATAEAFLNPDRYVPAAPSELPDLPEAADRLYRAIIRGEKIAVWGDFDADGQTATTLLVSLLRDLKAEVTPYIPQRLTESHGIKLEPLKRLLAQQVDVLLTCDTGIAEHEAIAYARSQGVAVLVTDHHELPEELPRADALINPQRLPAMHPLRSLPGVGVAFKLAQQVWQLAGEPNKANDYLDLVALGIVADVATMTADTRYLLQRGLDCLRRTARPGLKAMFAFAEINPANLSSEHIGYGLGPRLNALGRLGDANLAIELLTTTNLSRARILASQLEGLNNRRKLLMDQILAAAHEQLSTEPALLELNALVLHQPYWHTGVIGPVANRLAEQYQRPVVMLVGDGPVLRGSARSSAGVDITAALKQCGEFILSVGGHPGAAGLSLATENLGVFRRALSNAVEVVRDPNAAMAGLSIDAVLPLDRVTLELAQEIERFAPFGPGNPAVTFAALNLKVEHERTFGRKGEHREVILADQEGQTQKVTWWHGAEVDLPDTTLDIAFQIKASTFRGETALAIEWVDFREAEVAMQAVSAPSPSIEVIDWRSKNLAQATLKEFEGKQPASASLTIWADGAASASLKLTRRYDLRQAEILVIWSAPCGWRELTYAIERVKPATIYLCAMEAGHDHLEPFLKRLTGLLKHDLAQRDGRVHLPRLAAALNQRLITARTGVEWLEATGQITVRSWGDEQLLVALGGLTSDEADGIASKLKVLLAETSAWRQYYRRLKADLIADMARQATIQREGESA